VCVNAAIFEFARNGELIVFIAMMDV